METQFASGELVKQGISVEACGLGYLPHPFGTAFELSEARFSLSNLILPACAGLFICWPGACAPQLDQQQPASQFPVPALLGVGLSV